MKNSLPFLALITILFSGCGTFGGVFTPHETVTSQIVETVRTNEVVQLVTDQGVIVATNISAVVEKSYATNFFTNTTYTTSSRVESALGIGSSISAVVPSPWGGIASLALTLIASVLGVVAKVKNDRAAIVPALIQTIEVFNDPKVKELATSHATAAGVESALNAAVRKLTA